MKNTLFLFVLLFAGEITAQDVVVNQIEADALLNWASHNSGTHAGSAFFYNPKKTVQGSEYLFDSWDNSAILHTIDKQRFLIRNINFNINNNSFTAQISPDSIFTVSLNTIDKIVVNSKIYKSISSNEGKRIYEVLFEKDGFTLLKGFRIQMVKGSPNPMVNRSNDKLVRKESFFTNTNGTIKPLRLSKKQLLKLFKDTPERVIRLEKFMSTNRFSYKQENELKRGLEYAFSK